MKKEIFNELVVNLVKVIMSSKPKDIDDTVSHRSQILEDVEKYLVEFGKVNIIR